MINCVPDYLFVKDKEDPLDATAAALIRHKIAPFRLRHANGRGLRDRFGGGAFSLFEHRRRRADEALPPGDVPLRNKLIALMTNRGFTLSASADLP